MKTRSNISKLSQLKSDISTLEEKVSNFYNKYGEIPADIEYTNTSSLEPIMNNKEKTSESKFYVIDLQAMKGISLNYGRDYENVKNTNTQKSQSLCPNFFTICHLLLLPLPASLQNGP